jgi:hypothetical protein
VLIACADVPLVAVIVLFLVFTAAGWWFLLGERSDRE